MKHLIIPLLFILLSCGNNPTPTSTPTPIDTIAILKQAIAESMGTTSDSVEYVDGTFHVEHDAFVPLDDALLRHSNLFDTALAGKVSEVTQMMGYYRIDTSKYKVVKVWADGTVTGEWSTALDSAIYNLNTVGSNITFVRVFGSPFTTRITTMYSTSSTIASAAYPSYYGLPGSKVAINTYQDGLPLSKKIFSLVHELLHVIGMSHTNGTYGSLVNGSPVSDPGSVMNSTVRYWDKFSDYDLKAINKVYPK